MWRLPPFRHLFRVLLSALPPKSTFPCNPGPNYPHLPFPSLPPVFASPPGRANSDSRITIWITIPVSVPWSPDRHSDTSAKCHQAGPPQPLTPGLQHDRIKLGLATLGGQWYLGFAWCRLPKSNGPEGLEFPAGPLTFGARWINLSLSRGWLIHPAGRPPKVRGHFCFGELLGF